MRKCFRDTQGSSGLAGARLEQTEVAEWLELKKLTFLGSDQSTQLVMISRQSAWQRRLSWSWNSQGRSWSKQAAARRVCSGQVGEIRTRIPKPRITPP